MDLRTEMELHGGLLFVTASGEANVDTALRLLRRVCDTAVEKQVKKVLFDAFGVTGEFAIFERYRLGTETAAYIMQNQMNLKLAFVGELPATNGFGVRVAQNRGIRARLFATQQEAIKWLDDTSEAPAEDP